jgi:plasmid stability protein
MAVMIQVRHVPTKLHRRLKARAALAGVSLSDYILAELERTLERPTRAELIDRVANRSAIDPALPLARFLREERDAR